jgi:hypothetical protein
MTEERDDPVSVVASFTPGRGAVCVIPHKIKWRGQLYSLGEMGLYHPAKKGSKWMHVFEFSVRENPMTFRVELDPEDLSWRLKEVFYES